MSSSRVIKSAMSENSSELFREFSFQSIQRGVTLANTEPLSSDFFAPLAIFDSSEISGKSARVEPEPEPDGVFLTEEELDRRLRESFEQGLQDGKNLAERGLLNVFKALRTASEDILSLRERILRDSEDELLKLLVMSVRKVIVREVKQDREILAEVLRNALSNLSDNDAITVRLHPDDYHLVKSGAISFHEQENDNSLQIKQDPQIPIGFCQVDTDMGVVDATLDAQLEELYRSLCEEKTAKPAEPE